MTVVPTLDVITFRHLLFSITALRGFWDPNICIFGNSVEFPIIASVNTIIKRFHYYVSYHSNPWLSSGKVNCCSQKYMHLSNLKSFARLRSISNQYLYGIYIIHLVEKSCHEIGMGSFMLKLYSTKSFQLYRRDEQWLARYELWYNLPPSMENKNLSSDETQ